MVEWALEDGTPVTQEDLADEITLVPRTRYWRLSHLVILWPGDEDSEDIRPEGGFSAGFILELVAVPGAVEWLLQPVAGDAGDRLRGQEDNGRTAVAQAFAVMEKKTLSRRRLIAGDEARAPTESAQSRTPSI